MARAVVAILGLVVVGILAVQGFDAGLANAGDNRIIQDEVFDADAGTVVELDNSNRDHVYYDDEVEVYNDSSVRMVEGVDFIWFDNNGTIKPLVGGGIDGDINPTITYTFQVTTENERGIATALTAIPRFLEVGIILGGVLLFLLFIKG